MIEHIVGTAGHIDHGKTALVKALTGVETDRLSEERERGITIELGFAELEAEGVRLGVVDVPGHEGFVRNMLAGATGMDLALLVVAADEGIMPQTREHLAIVQLLGVRQLLVALTKSDLVEADWLELVRDEVTDLLAGTPWPEAEMIAVSVVRGEGIETLRSSLLSAARALPGADPDDVVVLPIDRVFSVRGTGTVVTGTLLSGTLSEGQSVHLLPAGGELATAGQVGRKARVRGLQHHGMAVTQAGPGSRTAVALTGDDIDLEHVQRGQTLVGVPQWPASSIVTAWVTLLDDTAWQLRHNQRVRLHVGTDEVMARVVLLESPAREAEALPAGGAGWVQLRTERPICARSGQPFVLRSYSPVTTIAGGRIAEPLAPKRTRLEAQAQLALEALLDGAPQARIAAALNLAGPVGVLQARLPVVAGAAPSVATLAGETGALQVGERWVSGLVARELGAQMLARLEQAHSDEPWRAQVSLDVLRAAVPKATAAGVPALGVADAVIAQLALAGEVELAQGRCRRAGHEPTLDAATQQLYDELTRVYIEAALTPPALSELPDAVRNHRRVEALLEHLTDTGVLVRLDETLWIATEALEAAARQVQTALGGQEGLGPADFRDVLPVTRKHLLPILGRLDVLGVTVREGTTRRVIEPK